MANTKTGNITHINVTTTTASTEILAKNAARRYALIINDSDTVIYLGIGVDAVVNKGIRLTASGGSYEMAPSFNNLSAAAINGINGTGSKVVCGLEME